MAAQHETPWFNSEPFGVSTEMAIDQVFFGGPSVS